MNLKTLASARISSAIAIVLSTTTLISQSSQAESTTFFCGTSNGVLATIAHTPKGDVPLILWNSSTLTESGNTPQKLCEEVSGRFQTYHDRGTLKYITTERKNGQLVACAAQTENQPCNGVLLTLESGDESHPRATLQRIFRIRVASSAPISETDTRVYISLDKYLNGEYPALVPGSVRALRLQD